MSGMERIVDSPFMRKLQELGGKLQSNKAMSAISSGMMSQMQLILAGSVFMIIATTSDLLGIMQPTDAIYQWLVAPYNATLGLMAIVAAFSIGYSYSKNLGMEGALSNGIVTMVLFLIVAAPIKTVTLADGGTMSVLDTTYLGSSGIFTAIILPLLSVRIIKLCKDHNLSIKMPDAVPAFLSDSFSNVIPLIINIVLWASLNTLCTSTLAMPIPGVIAYIFSIPLAGLNSVPGMFVITLVALLCWSCGIHGAMVVMMVMMPSMLEYFETNAALVAAGQPPVFQPIALYTLAQSAGGCGNCCSLALLAARSKSEQLRAVGKTSFVPTLFNISEPVVFGLPIMYNPVIIIPFVLNTLISMLLVFIGFRIGFFVPESILVMTSLPVFLNTFLTSMAWQNLLIPVICFVVSLVVYFPFVRAYDSQLLKQEAEARAAVDAA